MTLSDECTADIVDQIVENIDDPRLSGDERIAGGY